MREVLALVPLLGYYVVAERCTGERREGVVDSVSNHIEGTEGIRLAFTDGCYVDIPDPDDWLIGVYRRAPGKIPMPDGE